jgi:TetR/AcrR family transcriptional regulator, repressor of fatR-cypB operon
VCEHGGVEAPTQLSPRSAGALSTREGLLDAALEVFTEHTYAGAAVPMVAERAGIAVGTIYRHFPGKQALGNAVYQRWKGRLLERLSSYADQVTTRQAFAHRWGVLRDFAAEHPAAFAFLEYQQHAGYLDDESVSLTDRSTALAVAMVTRGQERGEVRAGDPTVLVALAYGAFIGLSKAQWSGAVVTEADFAAAEEAVWDLLRA